jgi:hypothetical protein
MGRLLAITLKVASTRLSESSLINTPWRNPARPLKNYALLQNHWLLLGSLMFFALVLNREGDRVPNGNEYVYLLYFWKAWHPSFLATDWTFKEPTAGHAVFNFSLGWLTLLMPLSVVVWLGRLSCWAATFLGLFRLGGHFKIPPLAVWAGLLLWLCERQAPVASEWMIGTFEAKVIAYPCLLFAIDAALADRTLLAGVLAGIAFSFHSAVGMWGGAALGVAVLAFSSPRKTLLYSVAAIVFGLPGLITSWPIIHGPHAISLAEAKYLTTVSLPDCFDPAKFPHTAVAALLLMAVFAWMHTRWIGRDRQIHQLLVFQIAMAVFFVFGIVARLMGRFDWVQLFPMRVYAVFGMLLFFWQGISLVLHWQQCKTGPRALSVFGLLIFLLIPSPLLGLRDMVASHLSRFLHPPIISAALSVRGDAVDFVQAAQWVHANTPKTDVVIAPPWWNCAFYTIQRPLIVNWHAPRYDAMTEWRERIETLVGGDLSRLPHETALEGDMDEQAWSYYASLSPAELERIRHLKGRDGKPYGGDWLITTGHYSYPLVFTSGTYSVYKLP